MTNDPQNTQQGVDVNENTPLPDIPDAGDDSQPITTANPVDFATADINADAALVAGTLNDNDDRTLYEQAVDAYEDQDDQTTQSDQMAGSDQPSTSGMPHVQIYDHDK